MTYVDVLRPSARRYVLLYDAACVFLGSLFIALSAQVVIPLPFSPVPITGQTLAALLMGALLGSRRGALCLIVYLAQGFLGLPVFAGGGFGFVRLMGPTGGYLVGMVAGAFVTGLLAERGWDRRTPTAFLAMMLGNLVVYAFGISWLAQFVGNQSALAAGLVPFIPGDIFKLVVAAGLLPLGWQFMGRRASKE